MALYFFKQEDAYTKNQQRLTDWKTINC